MRRTLKAAVLLALLAVASASAADERIHRNSKSHTLKPKTTEKKKFDLPVREAGRRVSLRLKAVVSEGEAWLVVRDSKGKVRQQAHLRPPGSKTSTYDVSTSEDSAAGGAWTVELEFREASGSYELTWTNHLP
jgi:hypothetical protein